MAGQPNQSQPPRKRVARANASRDPGVVPPALDFLSGGGEMGARMRAFDWAATPLGLPEGWPQNLKSAISLCLGSRFPIAIYWGRELVVLYNDAWSPIPGKKHPWALGRPAAEVWPEIWDVIGPLFEQVRATGEATYLKDGLLLMYRHGYTEECYFDYTFTPVRGETGEVQGIFNAVVETTYRVIGERRTRLLRELGQRIAAVKSSEEACRLAATTLAEEGKDVPVCLVYKAEDEQTARLVAAAGITQGHAAAPAVMSLTDGSGWVSLSRFESIAEHVDTISAIEERFGMPLPGGPWSESAREAMVASIRTGLSDRPFGYLVLGASPRRAVDEEYLQFATRAAAQLAIAVASAAAYEAERKRAEALAEIDRAKTVFFSNVSHEFRTPLTLMLGPLEEALQDAANPLTADHRHRHETVHRNALRLLKLVNSLLDFSRIEAGRIQASYEPTDIATLTSEIASSFRSLVERAGLAFTLDCPPLPEPVFVDREMWEKILLNLLSNAFKFTFEGEISVRVNADSRVARLVVRDTGTGIDEKHLPHVFERFYRVEGARGRTYEGTGIGLALVHELTRLHGGDVSVESEVGKGTTFTVTVPLGSAHLPPDRIRARRTLASTAVGPRTFVEEAAGWNDGTWQESADAAFAEAAPDDGTGSTRLLVADDNADMRAYLARLLRPLGTVELVTDGQEALAAIGRRIPDVVVSDVMMPGLDGFGLVRALREDPRTATLPIVLLSARAGEEARIEGSTLGADDYIVKPFSARELVARVGAQLKLARLRREYVAALRKSDERFKLSMEATNDGLWDWDVTTDGVYYSPSYCRILGYEGEFPGTLAAWKDLLHPDDRERTLQVNMDCVEGRSDGFVVEYRLKAHSGEWRWILGRGKCVSRDAQGRATRVIGTHVDITERKQAEEDLRKSEERYRNLFGNMTEGFALHEIITDEHGRPLDYRFLEVNPAFEQLTGLRRADLLGKRVSEVLPGIEAVWVENYGRVALTGESLRFQNHSADLDRWYEVFAYRPAPRQFAVVFTDITERKQAEEALRRSQAEIQTLLENTPAGLVLFEAQRPYKVLAHNRYYQELFAEPFRSRGMVGLNVFEYAPAVEAEGVVAVFDEVVRTRQPKSFLDFPYRNDPPKQSWFNWHMSPLVLDGTVVALVSMSLDVTERHLAEDALRRANAALAEADRRKDEFIAVLSHELRNPLAPIRYALPLVSEEPLGEGGRRAVAVIDRQIAHLTRLVDDLLDVSRITAGKIELRPEHVTLSAVVSAAVEAASPAIAAAQHSLDVSVPDAPIWLHADPARLSQAVTNLLNNSAKYTPKGGRIRLDATVDEGHIVIRVADNGVGIAADALPALFQMFHQVSTRHKPEGGLGIGLALTKQLVELQGGTVEAHSPGEKKGAEFIIRLPLAVTLRPSAEQRAPEAHPEAGAGCLRVLVVDDNVDLVDMLAVTIEADGHQVRKAFDGRSAISAALEYHPHVILLDVGMPGMDGTEVARELRRHAELAGTRIVALTGWGQAEDRRRTAEAGFDEHLTKPADPRRIQQILENVAQRRVKAAHSD